jgi:DNA-directed RNA polymerase sigma subunit (sigma70/sigma32)
MTNDLANELPVILTNVEQYRCELHQVGRFTTAEEEEVIERARCHDPQARDALITCGLRYVAYIAWYYRPYARKSDDYLDIVGVGNLALVENVDKALEKPNPIAFLFVSAKWAMIHYCCYHASLIPRRSKQQGAITCVSLDQPGRSGPSLGETLACEEQSTQPEKDYAALYRAIHQLDDKDRYVVLRHYGLDGDGPEPLTAISKRLSDNPKHTIAHLRLMRALVKLHRFLITDTTQTA